MVVISLCRLSSSAVRQCWPFPPISSNCTSSALTSKFPCLSCMYVGCFRFRKGFLMSMFLDIAQLQIAFDLRVDSCGATLALVFLSNGTLFGCPPDQTHTYFDCRVRLIIHLPWLQIRKCYWWACSRVLCNQKCLASEDDWCEAPFLCFCPMDHCVAAP